MTTIRDQVMALWKEDNEISVADLRIHLPNATSQVLSNYLAEARKGKVKLTKINEQEVEKAIIRLANKTVVAKKDMAIVKMMIDFLKIKKLDDGLENDINIVKFLKKAINADKLSLIKE